ncbi:MAG: hypothetical protein WCD70_02960 [Alphaproteobacteria bacterium]
MMANITVRFVQADNATLATSFANSLTPKGILYFLGAREQGPSGENLTVAQLAIPKAEKYEIRQAAERLGYYVQDKKDGSLEITNSVNVAKANGYNTSTVVHKLFMKTDQAFTPDPRLFAPVPQRSSPATNPGNSDGPVVNARGNVVPPQP